MMAVMTAVIIVMTTVISFHNYADDDFHDYRHDFHDDMNDCMTGK